MTFLAKLNKNGLDWGSEYNAVRWLDFIAKHQGKYVRIEEIKNKRSLNQNSLLWTWYELIASHCGYSANEVHRIFKGLFLKPKILKYRGRDIRMSASTTELTKGEMVSYMLDIEHEAAQLGVILPHPDDKDQAILK